MAPPSDSARFLRTVGIFAFAGPMVGTITVWSLVILAMFAGQLGHSTPAALLGGPLPAVAADLSRLAFSSIGAAYVWGFIPAAIAGVICFFLDHEMRSAIPWVVACTAVGAAAGALTGLIFTQGPSLEMATLVVPGGVAGAVCGLYLSGRRWR